MRALYHPSLCLSGVSFVVSKLSFHSVCVAQDKAPLVRNVRGSRSATATQGMISDCSGIVGSSAVHLGLHARVEGHMRRYILEQVVVHRHAGYVPLREINEMERKICQYLEWELNVDPVTLKEFEDRISSVQVPIPFTFSRPPRSQCRHPLRTHLLPRRV